MNITTRLILYITLTLTGIIMPAEAQAAPSATQILDKTAATFTTPASVKVQFVLNGNTNGTLTMARNKFTFAAGDMTVWYDGRQQWAMQKSTGEVNLTEPTAAELSESNPFALISSYKANYNVRSAKAPKGQYAIELTARRRSTTIRQAVVTVNASNYHPVSITATLSDGSKISLSVKAFAGGGALPATTFQFNAKNHPGVKLVDLR